MNIAASSTVTAPISPPSAPSSGRSGTNVVISADRLDPLAGDVLRQIDGVGADVTKRSRTGLLNEDTATP